jgi:hypothetical protein
MVVEGAETYNNGNGHVSTQTRAHGQAHGQTMERLLAPTFQNRLRAVGRHLDLNGYRSMVVLEVDGGILARALHPERNRVELMEFPEDNFRRIILDAMRERGTGDHPVQKSPLLPTGYEDFLRALGFQLDRRMAKAVTIVETRQAIHVSGLGFTESGTGHAYTPFDGTLNTDEIRALLDAAFRRRAPSAPSLVSPAGIANVIREHIGLTQRTT